MGVIEEHRIEATVRRRTRYSRVATCHVNWRATDDLGHYLVTNGIIAIADIDTPKSFPEFCVKGVRRMAASTLPRRSTRRSRRCDRTRAHNAVGRGWIARADVRQTTVDKTWA
jgi:carbamoylphosphate synthase small subunit